MILIAHIAGLPVEELLTPLAGSMAAGMVLAASVISRLRRARAHTGTRM